MDVARKKKQKEFFAAHAIGNRRSNIRLKKPVAVLVQNERSLGTNLSQLNEKRKKMGGKKRGLNPP